MSIIPESVRQLFTRPAFVRYVLHSYELGGYDVIPNVSIDLDERGLEFVRTFNLRDRSNGTEFRLIYPEDLVHQLTDYDLRMSALYPLPGACI